VEKPRPNRVLQRIRRVVSTLETCKESDQELLQRFVAARDEAAFATLVRRHGPMVLRVARRTLQNEHDAEDVFQATFLVLSRKAQTVRRRESLASWLYGVAYRLALKTRATAGQRRNRERRVTKQTASTPLAQITLREAQAILDEELNRLPEKFRVPVVLCCLEGLARDEAAHQVGWPASVLKSRLEQARERLRQRLVARGLTLPSGLGAFLLLEGVVGAAVPPALIGSTSKAAITVAAGEAATAVVSPKVAALIEGVVNAMLLTKLKIATIVLAVSMIGFGASLFAYRTLAGEKASAAPAAQGRVKVQQNQRLPPAKPKTDKEKLQGTWIVDSAVADGKPAPDYLKSLKLVFVGDKVTFHFTEEGNALVKEGTYALDSKKDPKEIDFTCDNRTQEAIYTFEKDRLKLALAELGQARPTKFTAGTREALIVFRKDVSEAIQKLIKQLDDNSFQIREQATKELKALGRTIVPQLEAALEQAKSPELRRRLEVLLEPYRVRARSDLDKLQGTWKLVAAQKEGMKWAVKDVSGSHSRLTLAGLNYQWRNGTKGTIKLNPGATPKELTFDGLIHLFCIYEVDGDTLRICFHIGRRPRAFETTPNSDTVLFTYQRE
jgi:RNA polymerase sigma factor (sigma-70 family)